MTEQTNVPKLRFAGFDGFLTAQTLEKLTTKISDGIHSTPLYDDYGDYFFINGNNFKNGVIQLNKNTKKVSTKEARKHYKQIGKQTILMSINGTIGNIAFYQGEPIMLGKSASYINVDPTIADKYFISNYLHREATKYYFDTELTGSTIKNLSLKAIKSTPIVYPTLPEQQKIASFLSKVDQKISLLSEKKAKLTEYKKGAMQQLFDGKWLSDENSQDEKPVFIPPTLRFKGDDGSEFEEWEERCFEDVFVFSSGKNIKQNEASPEFKTPCVRYGELYHLYAEVITNIENKTNLEHSELTFSNGNEILLPSAGEDPLDIGSASALTLKDVAIGRTINILRPKKISVYCHIYVSFYINNKLKKKISTLARGASISNVYNSDLKTLKIDLPKIEEQTKIANFLLTIDKKIDLTNTELEKAKQWKKGLLQQLFV